MFVVFCSSKDVDGLWAYRRLQEQGLKPLHLVTAEMLAYTMRWEHRIRNDFVHTVITLPDGRSLRSNEIRGALNRLTILPTDHMLLANDADREYAKQEMAAFFISWLYALPCPVFNPPSPHSLSGAWHSLPAWMQLASQAGLAVCDYTSGRNGSGGPANCGGQNRLHKSVIVAGKVVLGDAVPHSVAHGCRLLAAISKTPLLGVTFRMRGNDEWTFIQASSFPRLMPGGSPLVRALAKLLLE